MSSKNVQTAIEVLFDAFNDRDLDRAASAYADGVRFIDHARGVTIEGHDEVKAMFGAAFDSGFSGIATIDEIVDAGDTVVFQFTISGATPDGKAFSVPACDIVRFDADGRIVSEDNYSDQLSMLQQTGAPLPSFMTPSP
jgi:ketosteroid isomerase-like protein